MAVTDLTLLAEIQATLQEDPTFSNGLWTLPEVLGYLNQRQNRFLKESRILGAQVSIPWTPQVVAQPLPDNWITTLGVLWHDFLSATWTPLPRSDQWELDHVGDYPLTTNAIPAAYRDGDVDTLTLAVGPAPSNPGELDLLYVPLGHLLDGLGSLFDLPDEWVPYVKYGVLADMLGKDGRGQDLLRARYAEVRFTEGVALAEALLKGWS